ncbi:MAG: glycyl-radical enzyme activating protein [Desulfuromonadales bacterium]|nr:glycyl-radical enzyme activating protein [Actinomycetota bacterium]MDZ4184687.1 glycyl-radical enzyme activating protein [Desulfuromonadales bacterium]
MEQGLIFDIKRYSINDGPGIRATLFFKGCPLHCRWCHNPESIAPQSQKLFSAAKCLGCGECAKVCPAGACTLTPSGMITDPVRCILCGRCAALCPTLATQLSGRYYRVDELLAILEKERHLFDQSGGGVTCSGGEPLQQSPFLRELLIACGQRQLHRAVDTSGLAPWEVIAAIAAHTDLFLYDLKLINSERHRQYTGVDNGLILANLQRLAEQGAALQIRLPLIGGVNLDDANIEATARCVAALAGEKKIVNLLPFHDVARGKDQKLGQERNLLGMYAPTPADIEGVIAIFAAHGLTTTLGG